MTDWLRELFDMTGILTYGAFGSWSETLTWISIASNALVAATHLLVAAHLYAIWRKRRGDIHYPGIVLFFTALVIMCGLTYLCDIAMFVWPGYKLFTMITMLTAILSAYAIFWLPWMTNTAFIVPSPALFRRVKCELEQAIALKDEAINESRSTIAALRRQVDHLERMRRTGLWVAEQESALRELKTALHSSNAREAAL